MDGEFSLAWINRLSLDEEAIIDEEDYKLKQLCDSRDRVAIQDYMTNLKNLKSGEELVRLFELAVVQLTCNNDEETLDAVLHFGKKANLGVSWSEVEDVLSSESLYFPGNPILAASQQVCVFMLLLYHVSIQTQKTISGLCSMHCPPSSIWVQDPTDPASAGRKRRNPPRPGGRGTVASEDNVGA